MPACGDDGGKTADAAIDAAAPVAFTGELIDWDSDHACGVYNAKLALVDDATNTDTTAPNGRIMMMVPDGVRADRRDAAERCLAVLDRRGVSAAGDHHHRQDRARFRQAGVVPDARDDPPAGVVSPVRPDLRPGEGDRVRPRRGHAGRGEELGRARHADRCRRSGVEHEQWALRPCMRCVARSSSSTTTRSTSA